MMLVVLRSKDEDDVDDPPRLFRTAVQCLTVAALDSENWSM